MTSGISKLGDCYAEVAQAIYAERRALQLLRKPECDRGHRSGEVGAGDPSQRRPEKEHPIRGFRISDRKGGSERRQQKQECHCRIAAPAAESETIRP